MKPWLQIAIGLICLALLTLLITAGTFAQQPATNSSKKKPAQTAPGSISEGEKRFQVNCSRCHNAPESLSPREVPAVVRHMRVRAMLSAEDEKLIRQYLAP